MTLLLTDSSHRSETVELARETDTNACLPLRPPCSQLYFKSKSKLKLNYPSDPGPNRPKFAIPNNKMTVRALPRSPHGGGGDNKKQKNVLKYSWA